MNVRFVGGSLDGQASDIQDWAMQTRLPLADDATRVRDGDWYRYIYRTEVYEADPINQCYRYTHTEGTA